MALNKIIYNSTYEKKGTRHMTTNKQNYEPQRTNNFEVQIHIGKLGVPTLSKIPDDNTSKSTTPVAKSYWEDGGARDDVMLSVASFSAPQINVSPITVSYGNNKIKYAGVPEFPSSSLTLNDYIGLDVEKLLYAWYTLVYDPSTEKVGRAENYKTDAHLIEYSPDGECYRIWHLRGVWPSSLQMGEFSQDNNSVRQISMDLQYDYCYLDTSARETNGDSSGQDWK